MIALVPKKIDEVQTGWRMIFDLFCSIDVSVNDRIPSKYEKINYQPLEKAIKLVTKANHEAMIMKHNLKITFHHILINSIDY